MTTTKATPQQWALQAQGTLDAILRTLGEVIAKHPARDAVMASLAIQAQPSPQETEHERAQRLAEEEGIQAVFQYARTAMARAEALNADPTGSKH